MRRSLTIKFVDFWPTFNSFENKFVDALRARHDVEVLPSDSDTVPDVLFYSRCGVRRNHLKYDCLKVYFTAENDFPDFNECDYAISFYDMDCGGRNLRYPLYMLYEVDQFMNPPFMSDEQALVRGFCSVVMRNVSNCDPLRLNIIDAVEAYKSLAYGGPYRNNVGGPVENKLRFISGYKFHLALENSLVDGYVTEKLLEPLAASTVPIYWGSDIAKKDFNPDAFINVGDYDSIENCVKDIRRIDSDPEAYLKMLRAPNSKNCSPADFDGRLEEFLDGIASGMIRRRTCYGEMGVYQKRNRVVLPLWDKRYARGMIRLMSKVFK